MSGPIVRTGTTPKFWENWEQAFGSGKAASESKKSAGKKKAPKADAKKSVKKKKKKS